MQVQLPQCTRPLSAPVLSGPPGPALTACCALEMRMPTTYVTNETAKRLANGSRTSNVGGRSVG